MAVSRNHLLPWLTLAVLVPLLVLAGLAVFGMRAQRQAVWTDAREEASRLAPEQARVFAEHAQAARLRVPLFADPPIPGIGSDADAVLDGQDIAALLRLRNDPQAGVSPAGLPRRVLAALRVFELDPTAQPMGEIEQLVTREAPSVLTSVALRKIGRVSEAWNSSEQARELFRSHPELAKGGWLRGDEGWWWLEENEGGLLLLPPSRIRAVIAGLEVPMWARVSFGESGSGLASAAVPMGEGLVMRIIAVPEVLEKSIRQQQRWTLALLGLAVGISAIALVAIHRVVQRERRLSELKSQFVSSVSHELRAPLASIRLMAEALEQGKISKLQEFYQLIAREGARLSHLIENVLDFARIEEGRKRYQIAESDLTAVVRDSLLLLAPLAKDRGVKIDANLAEITATLDTAAIQQAVVNLLDNALKFSPPGSTVSVALGQHGVHWHFSVRDEGPGVPVAEQTRIFERFYRLGNELRRETQGTGIGLSLVKHIAEGHGGTVTVTSEPPAGSTFLMKLLLCAS